MVCPPATLVLAFAALARGSQVAIGGQDCHAEASGAFTGDVAAEMLKDAGASAVIVGHSERRADHHESDAEVAAKARAAWRAQLTAIVCIGETKDERAGGRHTRYRRRAVAGLTARRRGRREYRHRLRAGLGDRHRLDADARRCRRSAWLYPASDSPPVSAPQGEGVRILYGGSVKPSNAGELMDVANVNGALVGGASLKAEDFLGIAGVYR